MMTYKKAKKILEKEGFIVDKIGEPRTVCDSFTEYESPDIIEAMQVVSTAGYDLSMEANCFEKRKACLKKEYEKNTKAPGPGEEQSKEGDLKAAIKMFGAQAREIMRLTAENAELRETIDKMKEGNPALEESASQFNDALLNEQGKKIAELTMENERLKDQVAVLDVFKKHNDKINRKQIKGLGKEIAKLNGIIHKKNLKIEELGKESSRHLEGKMKMFGENFDLEQMLKDKNAVLSDVAEELRLSKIREKNLTELCQKYIKANEELKEKLADKVVDKIDAQVLKSAESALAYKEKVIADLKEKLKSIYKNRHIERVYKKKLVEKDEVIDNLHKELKAQKGLKDEVSLKYIGVKHNLKLRMDECEKLKKELDEAKKQNTAVMVDMTAKCLGAARESINDVFESYAAKYAKSALDELKEKAYNSFNAKAHNLGLVGSKDGNGITDQMEEEKKLSPFRDDSVGAVTNQKDCSPIKDTHPTEDNPEEVEMDEILEFVRKALEEGHTVSIDYDKAEEGGDQSATIVECGKDIDDVFKEIKRLCQE